MERNDPLADRAPPTDQPRTPRRPDLTARLPRRCAGGPHRGVRHLPRGRRPLEHGHVPEGVPPGERVARAHPGVPRRRLALQFGSGEAVLPGAGGGADRESQHVGGFGASERLVRRRAFRWRNYAQLSETLYSAHTSGSTPTSTPATCSRSPTDASLSSTLGSSGASRRRPPRACSTSCAPSRSATWAASRRR